jgi:hypothetical protein
MKNSGLKYFIILSISLLLNSCEADIDIHNISGETSIQPTVVLPIGTASIGLGEFLINNKVNGIVAEDDEIYFQDIDTAEFKFRDIGLNINQLESVERFYLSSGQVVVTKPFSELLINPVSGFIDLGLNSNSNSNEERIDSIIVSSTMLNFQVNVSPTLKNIQPSNLEITLVFPNKAIRKLDGTTSDITFFPTIFGKPNQFLMSNFVINTQDNATGIPIEIRVKVKTGAIPLILDESSMITCSMNFNEMNYKVAYGFFQPDNLANQIVQQFLDTTTNLPNSKLKFQNPKVEISVVSNIGSYLNFKVDYIKAFVRDNPDIEPVYAWFDRHTSNSTVVVMDVKPNLPGDSVTKVMPSIDENWGETNALFENEFMPNVIEYMFSLSANKELNRSDPAPQFITPDAMIKAYVKTTIPLQFNKGSYYIFEGTFDNIFDDVSVALDRISKNAINSVALILDVKNGLPVKSQFIFEILDSIGNIVPTDFIKQYDIKSAAVNQDGIVQTGTKTNQIINISVTKEQLEILRKANSIVYKIIIDGEQVDSKIHFTKSDTFDLKVGLLVNGEQ